MLWQQKRKLTHNGTMSILWPSSMRDYKVKTHLLLLLLSALTRTGRAGSTSLTLEMKTILSVLSLLCLLCIGLLSKQRDAYCINFSLNKASLWSGRYCMAWLFCTTADGRIQLQHISFKNLLSNMTLPWYKVTRDFDLQCYVNMMKMVKITFSSQRRRVGWIQPQVRQWSNNRFFN